MGSSLKRSACEPVENFMAKFFCSRLSTLTKKPLALVNARLDKATLATLQRTKAGFIETVLKELQVMAQSWLSKCVVTMVTPVVKQLIASLMELMKDKNLKKIKSRPLARTRFEMRTLKKEYHHPCRQSLFWVPEQQMGPQF